MLEFRLLSLIALRYIINVTLLIEEILWSDYSFAIRFFFNLTPDLINRVFCGLASVCYDSCPMMYTLPFGGGSLASLKRCVLSLGFKLGFPFSDESLQPPSILKDKICSSFHPRPKFWRKLRMFSSVQFSSVTQ